MQPRLLIVEDDAPLRDVLTRSLRAEGFAASGVATGGDLFERAVSDGSEVGGLALDPSEHSISSSGSSQTLTPTEFGLLGALAARPGKALARHELVRAAWPHGAIVHDNTLDVYIARIRRKLAQLPDVPQIATLHGVGYRLG